MFVCAHVNEKSHNTTKRAARILAFSKGEKAYVSDAFDSKGEAYAIIGILIRRFAPPSPTWRRLICALLSLPIEILRSRRYIQAR